MKLSINIAIFVIVIISGILYSYGYFDPPIKVSPLRVFDNTQICESYFNWENITEQISEGMRKYCK